MNLTLRKLEKEIKYAKDYQTWYRACCEHDRLSGADDWKTINHSPHFDHELIQTRLYQIRRARRKRDVNQLVFHLHEGLHGNLGNISNPLLYAHTKVGTKTLIEGYLDEVCSALHYVCDNDFPNLSFKEKLDFFTNTSQAFGQTALLFSGGAALGLFHIGVAKALLEHKLFPSVFSGSSAGSIIAGAIGTHTDDELQELIASDKLSIEAFKYIGLRGILRGQPILDGDHLEACLQHNIQDMTFEEAYRHTGRQINVTVSPYDRHQEARLLNWKTSPNVLIRKAVLASSAVPAVFPAVTLWAKNVHNEKVPYIPTRKWVDGSIKDDLPIARLARLYGVNHTIVSQTNPHILPFISRKTSPPRLGNLAWTTTTRNLQLNINLALEVLQYHTRSNDMALLLNKAQSIFKQKYIGDINIIPPRQASNIFKIFKNPTLESVKSFIMTGERATWPRLEMIRNTTAISRTFQACLMKLNQQEAEKLSN